LNGTVPIRIMERGRKQGHWSNSNNTSFHTDINTKH